MKRFFALVGARNKEYFRDRGAMGWNFIFPFLVVFGFAFGSSGRQDDVLKWGLQGDAPAYQSVRELQAISFVTVAPEGGRLDAPGIHASIDSAINKVRRHQLDLLVSAGPEGELRYWINPASNKSALSETILKRSVSAPLRKETVEGAPIRYVDWLVPGLVCMNLMFNSLFGVGYVLVRYRKNGVLKRLNATPVRAHEFLAAQIVSRIGLVLFSSLVFLLGARYLVGVTMNGSWLSMVLILVVGSACMIALSLVVAARVTSEEVAEGLLNVMTWPMMFLSGAWFSLEGASPLLLKATKFLPLTHMIDASRSVMIDGASLGSILPVMGLLGAMTLVFFVLGSALFRWS